MQSQDEDSVNEIEEYEKYHLADRSFEWLYSFNRQNRVFDFIVNENYQKVLEVGIGTYPLACNSLNKSIILNKTKLKVASVEPSRTFVDLLHDRKRDDIDCQVFEDTLEAINESQVCDFLGGFPELVVLNSLLHEITDLENFFLKLRNIIDNNSKIWINVPNISSLHHQLFSKINGITNLIEQDEHRSKISNRKRMFDSESLIRLMNSFDFRCVKISSFGFKPFTFSQLECCYESPEHRKLVTKEVLSRVEIRELYGAELEAIFESQDEY